jgi:hypothetical protein
MLGNRNGYYYFGVCSTPLDNVKKEVTIPDFHLGDNVIFFV